MATAKKEKKATSIDVSVTISPPRFAVLDFEIEGDAPYVQHKFSEQDLSQIIATQKAGSTTRSKKKREPKDFDQVYKNATHYSPEGWIGIPAISFRHAMITACKLVGFKMTHAKLSIKALFDGVGTDGSLLIKIKGNPIKHTGYAKNATGVVDVRVRPMWKEWSANVRIEYDQDQFTADDITNLLMRAGAQCGIGEGRPSSPNSFGQGWGTFKLKTNGDR